MGPRRCLRQMQHSSCFTLHRRMETFKSPAQHENHPILGFYEICTSCTVHTLKKSWSAQWFPEKQSDSRHQTIFTNLVVSKCYKSSAATSNYQYLRCVFTFWYKGGGSRNSDVERGLVMVFSWWHELLACAVAGKRTFYTWRSTLTLECIRDIVVKFRE